MKSYFSAPAPKFNTWLTVCALGASLLGLPIAALAQDALVVPSTQGVLQASQPKIYVNHTTWKVEPANSGQKRDYAPVPWEFLPNGTARSGNLWQGTWHLETNDTIRVSIQMNGSGATDTFLVKFKNSSKFTAYKNGTPYRYGVRQ
jgi:hypothetical protein